MAIFCQRLYEAFHGQSMKFIQHLQVNSNGYSFKEYANSYSAHDADLLAVKNMCQVFVDSPLNLCDNKEICVVSWTGSKDCILSFWKCHKLGYNIAYLITFAPKNPDFRAHVIELVKFQAELLAVGIKHL